MQTKFNCKLCRHPKKKSIEKNYILGDTVNKISSTFNLSYSTVKRHMNDHLSRTIASERKNRIEELQVERADYNKEIPSLSNLTECVEFVHAETLTLFKHAKGSGDHPLALKALHQDLECLSLVMRAKELMFDYQKQNNWENTLTRILTVLDGFKDAKEAVGAELYSNFGGDEMLEKLKLRN